MADRRDRDRRRSKAETESSRRPRRRESTKDSTRGTDIVEEPADMRPQYASPSTFLRPNLGEAASYYTQSPLAEPLTTPPVMYDNKPPRRLSVSSSGSSSYINISRTFPGKRPRGVGALRAFFTTPAEHRRRPRRRKSQRTLNLGGKNSSSSSINSDLAYGTGFIKRRKGERRRSLDGGRRSSKNGKRQNTRDENSDAKILAVGAGLAALAKKQNAVDLVESRRSGSFYVKRQDSSQRHGLESSRGIGSSKIHDADEDGWYSDDSGSGGSSIDSRLAYGGSTTDFFGFEGSKPQRPRPRRKSSVVDPKLFGPQNSLQGIITRPVGFEEVDYGNLSDYRPPSVAEAVKLAKYEPRPMKSDVSGTTAMKHVYPISTSDPTRFDVAGSSVVSSQRDSRPGPVPLQHPQPYTPVSQSVYEPSISAPIVSGQRKSQSVAGAALAGVAGAAIGATILSDNRDERKEVRRREDNRDRYEDDRRRKDRRERRSTQDIDSEKPSSRRRDGRYDPAVTEDREQRKEKGGKHRDDFDEDEIRRQRRRTEERNNLRDEERESRMYGDRFDKKEFRRPANMASAVDPSQFKDDKDVMQRSEVAKGLESFTEINRAPSPAVITVDRVPHFAKEQSDLTKDQGRLINDDDRRDYRKSQDRKRTEWEAEDAYEEIGHFTAPIEIGAIGAAVAAEREAEHRHDKENEERRRRRDDDDDDSDPRRREPRRSKKEDSPKRDPVQAEADRIYREAVLARKIASRKNEDDNVVRITTPPEMEHKPGPSPYDAPNADFHLDHVMGPTDFKEGITPVVELQEFPLPKNYFHVQDEDVKAHRRPLMTLVMPTPTASPTPEKQKDRNAPKVTDDATQSSEPTREVKGSQTQSNGTRSVTWGENETKHYQPESPHEYKDEFIESTSKAPNRKDESKPKKASRWGAVKGAFMGVGAAGGVAAANALVDAAEAKKDAKPEKESAKAEPYEYRGVVVEPELSDDEKTRGPPAVGPKPSSPQPRSPEAAAKVSAPHVPGSFADDLDFTATVAAGLQDSGFDPNIVIDDPKYRRRNSPPGTNDDSKGLYRQPYAETVSDLDHFPEKFVEHENVPRGDEVEFEDEFTTKLTKKEQRKREKAVKRQSTGGRRDMDPSEEIPATAILVEEPETYFEPSNSKRDKRSKKSKKSYDDGVDEEDNKRVSVSIDDYDDLLQNEPKAETPVVEWDISSKKSKKKSKRDSEIADSPSRSMSTAETYDDILLRKSNDKSGRKGDQYEPEIAVADVILPVSEISTRSDESSKSRKSSKRDSSFADDHSIRSESNERRKSKNSSKRDNSPPDDCSQVSSKYDDEGGGRSSKKKAREKENKNGGFFGLFGSSTSKSEPEAPQDDVEQPKKKKKSKRSSTADSDNFVDAQSYPNGNNNYRDDPLGSKKSTNSDSYRDVEEGEPYEKDENSFLDNAGTLGAGVGLAGAAVIAAQHMQSKAVDANEELKETDPFLYQVSDDAFSTPDASKDDDPFTELVKGPDGSYVRIKEAKTHESDLATTVSTAKDIIDPEISERQFRPSIDPQYGDLLPLPPSDPGSPDSKQEPMTDLPELPESRPNSPPRFDQFSSRDRPSTMKKTDHQTPMKSPSASAVPLKFMMGNRSQPSSPRVAGPSPVTSPAVASSESIILPSRPRPRPTSWDSTKEIQPLRLLDPSRKRDSVDLGRTQGLEAEQTLDKDKSASDEHVEEESSKPALAPRPDTSEHDSGSLVLSAIAGSALALETGALMSSLNNEEGVERSIQTTEHMEEFHQPSPVQPGTKDRSSYLFHSTPPSKRFGDLEEAFSELEPSSLGETSFEVTQGTPTNAMQRGLHNSSIVNNEVHTELSSFDMMAIVTDKAVAKREESKSPEDEPPSLSPPFACEMPTTGDSASSEEFSMKSEKGEKGRKQTFDDTLAQKEGHPTASPLVEQSKNPDSTEDLSFPQFNEEEKRSNHEQTFDDIFAEEEVHSSVLPPAEEVKGFDRMNELTPSKSTKDQSSDKRKQTFDDLLVQEQARSIDTASVEATTEADVVDEFSMPKFKIDSKNDKKKQSFDDTVWDEESLAKESPPVETNRNIITLDEFSVPKSKKSKKSKKKQAFEELPAEEEPANPASPSDLARDVEPVEEFSIPISKKDKKKSKKTTKEQSEQPEFLTGSTVLPLGEDDDAKDITPQDDFALPLSKKREKKKKSTAREEELEALSNSMVLPIQEEAGSRDTQNAENLNLPLTKLERDETRECESKTDQSLSVVQEADVITVQPQTSDLQTIEKTRPVSEAADDFSFKMSKKDKKDKKTRKPSARAAAEDLAFLESTIPVAEFKELESKPQEKLSAAINRDADVDPIDVEQDPPVLGDIPLLQDESVIPDEPADKSSMSKSKKDKKKGKKWQSSTVVDEAPAQIKPVANVEKHPQINPVQSQHTQHATESTELDTLQPDLERTSSRNGKNRHEIDGAELAGTTLTGAVLSNVIDQNEQPQDIIRAISPSREEPAVSKAPDGFDAGFTAEQLEAARQMREDFGSGAMKTKKELMQDKKSAKGKKSRSTSRTPQQDLGSRSSYFQELEVTEPEQTKEDYHENDRQREGPPSQRVSGGFAAGFTEEQLEDARQMRESFTSGSMKTKKELKQEKKKRQNLLRMVTDGEIERSVDKGLEQASLTSSEADSPTGTGASTPNIQEEFDEFSFAPKSKKEKKRQSSLLRTSTLDIDPSTEVLPTVSTGLKGIQTEATDVTRGRELEKTPDLSVPAKEGLSYSLKKSKKDKKSKKRQSSIFDDDTPADTPPDKSRELEVMTAGSREAEEVQPTPAELVEDELYSSTKSTKDREVKTRQSPAIGEETLVKPHPEVAREPESILIDNAQSNVGQEADERQLETNALAEEESYLIKSKKNKKSNKRESLAVKDELSAEPLPTLSYREPGNTSTEPNESIDSVQADHAQFSTTELAEEEFNSPKNSKNSDKEKMRHSTSVSPFEDDVVSTEKTGSKIIATAPELSDKSVIGRSLADQIWDSVISQENEYTLANTEVPALDSTNPLGLTSSTKKSKKDKKKKKDFVSTAPWEEDSPSEPVLALEDQREIETRDVPKTELSETPDKQITPQAVERNTSDKGDNWTGYSTGEKTKDKKKQSSNAATSSEEDFRSSSIQTDEFPKTISTDPQAVSTVVQPETEVWSGFNTGRKLKKDKKKKGSGSATPFEDEFKPGTDMLKTNSHGLAMKSGVNQAGNSDNPDLSKEVEDWAGTTSGKKSKKDKKKARKDLKAVTLLELVAAGSETRESPASNSVPDESTPLSWADEVAEANNSASKDAVLEIHRHEEFGPIPEQVFPESIADDMKIYDTTVSQKMVLEPEPIAESTTPAIISEAFHEEHRTVDLAEVTGMAIVGASLISDGFEKSPKESKHTESISNFPLEPVSQLTEATPEISHSPSEKEKGEKRHASITDRRLSASDDILDDSSLLKSSAPRNFGDDKNERAAEDGGDRLPIPVGVEPHVVDDSAAQISTAEHLDRQAPIDKQKEDPQARDTARQVSELRQMFEKEAPQEKEGHREVPQTREKRDKENPQVQESFIEMRQPQEASELREVPQQREKPHYPEASQSKEFSDEITDVTEPGHKRAHEEVVDAALVAAGFHSVAGVDEALEQNATEGKSYQFGGVVPDQQWNDLPDDLITKSSKKSKKGKNKSRLAAWDVPTRIGESATVEAPMRSIPEPEMLVTMPQSHERESSDYQSREVVDPQYPVDQKQEIIMSIPRDADHAREIVDPQQTSFNEPTWSFPGQNQLQLGKDQPSIPKTPEHRSHNTIRNQDNHWSSPAPLPVVIEEDSPDQQRFAKTPPEPEIRFRGHDPNDVNRDSGLVTGSPIPPHRATYTDDHDHDHIRDSGVHLRDWPDSSPSTQKREISSTDDALARMSWPSVDEESETVNLDRSQQHQGRSHSKDHSSKGSSIVAATTALAGAGMVTHPARSVSDISRDRASDKQSHTERRASDNFTDRDSDQTTRPERRVSDNSDEKDSRKRNRSDRRSFDKYDGPDSDKRTNTEHRPSDKPEEKKADKGSHAKRRSISPSFTRLQTPDHSKVRPVSVNSIRSTASATPPLRRSDRRVSGDLRSLSQANLREAKEVEGSPATSIVNSGPIVANEGRVRSKDMADVYDGFGEGRIGSPMSPTRPHSMRRRQSMQVLDLEARLEQSSAENRALSEAKVFAEQNLHASRGATSVLAAREAEVDSLKQTIDWLHKEVEKLKEVNDGLTSANIALGQQHNHRYDTLATQHEQATRELEDVRSAHGSLSAGMESIVRNEVEAATHEKDREIEQLKLELEAAKEQIREMQRQILASKAGDSEFLTLRDEDYFDTACQTLCQHVQQWVLRFSKFSDMRACRLTSEINNDKIIDKLDNAVLDGSDVDNYLSDRVRRRDIFMSMTMTMIWEFVFARYLFGMDREQRQKLKALEKTLSEVGPASAVHQWRATTLTLLAKREAFRQQREQDTEAVVQLVFQTLSEILPPPTQLEEQIQDQLRRVMKAAVDLSIEMRTQRAEYMMLPPLQPVYDPNGDLAQQVHFNAALMNERSGDTSSNEDLEAQKAVVRVVLFPLVVKKGDDSGEGDEEIVVCPAQVLVAKSKKQVRVFSPDRMDMSQNHSRVSMQSGLPAEHVEDI